MDWQELFVPTRPILEMVLRGTFTYLSLFAILRVVLNRQAGALGVGDLLVIVLIADAAQNALTGGYESVTEGIILVATVVFWSYSLDWLGYRFPRLQRLVRPPPLLLIQDGRVLRRNLRRELITHEELMSQLREQGVDDPARVKRAYMEGDGRISVIAAEPDEDTHRPPERRAT